MESQLPCAPGLCSLAALNLNPPLIQLENVDVALGGTTVLHDLTWRLQPGEHWAILGGNGSGKSTLLKLLRGELAPAPGCRGRRVYAFEGDVQITAVGIKEKIALVSPELQGRYLQQEWLLTGLQVIHSGFLGGDYIYQRPTPAQRERATEIVGRLGVEALLHRNVQQLSTGELRKILIARALAGSPRVLVCDEVCDGLDATARADLLRTLDRVAGRGTQLLYTTHRAEELIPAITHRLVLERGRILEAGPFSRQVDSLNGVARRAPAVNIPGAGRSRRLPRGTQRDTLIRVQGASVYLGDKPVLRDIDLEIRRGEHWAVVGGNGSGKTTLLKLIVGDLHPAWGGRVQRFAFTPKNTLWEVKKKIGYLSPELQANYRESITGADVIASGFFSSIGLMQTVSRAQRRRVTELVELLQLGELAARNALQMSYGEVRRLLLARALVHEPELLVCDEPFDGLDAGARSRMAATLEQVARGGTNLLMVTHHAADLPACTTHVAELRTGAMTFRGCATDYFRTTKSAHKPA